MSNQPTDRLIPVDINSLSFDSFGRDPQRDVICLTPIRTIIRREEEIVLIRRVRKVEEIDVGLSCPATTVPLSNPFSTAEQYTDNPDQQIVDSYQTEPASDSSPQAVEPSYPPELPSVESEELTVHSQRNCLYIAPEAMTKLQQETSVSRVLYPGTYTISLKSGAFDYQIESGHPGEPWVLLWFYGGKIVNHQTGVEVGATWTSLNGLDDAVTIDVREPVTLCAFFLDTYLDDNEGEVTITVDGADYATDLVVHSQRNCFYIDPNSMKQLEQIAVSKRLQPGTYDITLKDGAFSYRTESGSHGEPLVLLWIYGGQVTNHQTGVTVGATWSSLNGYGDTLTLSVQEPATLCAFFYDTYLEDNEGEVTIALSKV